MTNRIEQLAEGVTLYCGDCLAVLPTLEGSSVDAIVSDPPYGLEFMGKGWDGADGFRRSLNGADAGRENVFGRTSRKGPQYRAGNLFQQFMHAVALECLRVLKPGGHLMMFGGTRTYHRLACAIEDAGFEVRDCIMWIYGSGFPKSLNVSKAIDKEAGAERPIIATGDAVRRMIPGADQHKQGWEKNSGREFVPTQTEAATPEAAAWEGWGTALKPACEPIIVARKPLIGTVAENVLKYGTGALNIDECRVATNGEQPQGSGDRRGGNIYAQDEWTRTKMDNGGNATPDTGRWPANVVHDGSPEVTERFPAEAGAFAPVRGTEPSCPAVNVYGEYKRGGGAFHGDSGSAARFFYTPKADVDDRIGSKHPTVKPLDLMQWLVRLVTPPKGAVLDPFAGTGTTGEACLREGFQALLIEREAEHCEDIRRRMKLATVGRLERRRESIKHRLKDRPVDHGPLFAGSDTPPRTGRQVYGVFADEQSDQRD